MEDAKILIYDGTFNGYLTTVFTAYKEKIQVAAIQKSTVMQNGLFSEGRTILTAIDKAQRVWNAIQKKSDSAIKNVYFAFLSEEIGVELLLYHYIKKIFSNDNAMCFNFSSDTSLKVNQLAKSVSKEKYHIESFLRFKRSENNIYRSTICPENDILPLLSKHFRSQYPNQKWLIYDSKRKYGLYYNLNTIVKVFSESIPIFTPSTTTINMPILKEKLTA